MSESDQRIRRAFLLGLRRAKARHRAERRDLEDQLDELEDEAKHRAHIEAARAAERDDDEGLEVVSPSSGGTVGPWEEGRLVPYSPLP